MSLCNKIKQEYSVLSEKEKNNFKGVMVEALAFVPLVGQATNLFNSVSEWNKYKTDKIIPQIIAIAKPDNIDEDIQNKIAYALKNVFSNNNTIISKYASVKRKEFEKLIYDKYNECSLVEYDSPEVKDYIQKIIDTILNNIDMLETPESYGKTALKTTADHEERITALEEDKHKEQDKISDDNEIFVKKYTATELFLDKGERKIYLNDVYVSPIIKGKDTDIDLYTQLNEWRKKPDPTREYTDADAKILLLYGKAGIGKSSLVAKLISDNFFNDAAHAIILNKKAELLDHEDPWGSIKRIYGCENDICYNNKVLILDGFDEVCVLKNDDFKGNVFLQKLANSIPSTVWVKVLITSREARGYFERIEEEKGGIIIRYVDWNEDLLFQWCENYLYSRNGDKTVEKWVDDFKDKFDTLDDKLQDAFYSPIILYICCHENIEIFEMDSIAEIYYNAFHKVAKREYITSDLSSKLCKTDEQNEKILWQYLKEIAFQIFLTPNHTDTAEKALIDKARSFMGEYKECINPDVFEMLPAIFHFSSGNDDGGIVFVHKTVAEYYIAVKIFEDFFKDINAETDDEKVWNSIYSALSLRKVPYDIIKNICAMMTSSNPSILGDFDKEAFFTKFESGMKQELILKSSIDAEEKYADCIALEESIIPSELRASLIIDRNKIVIMNLTWLLNELGYRNKSFTLLFKYLMPYLDYNLNLSDLYLNSILYPQTEAIIFSGTDFLIDCPDGIADYIKKNETEWVKARNDVKLNNGPAEIIVPVWNYKNLAGCYFQNTHMEFIQIENSNLSWCHFENAYLHGASLRNSDFSRSCLNDSDCSNANFENADLSFSYLTNTNLKNANLKGVDFTGAYLTGADLTRANLENAIFKVTYYNSKTKFPEGFVPDPDKMKCICCGQN
ncbi:pentapeptide repeat-containing protein [Ruminococcus flavefaciens]|uniref:Pentapeptide repeat protein n=1 Tax=Ruminococcus flavefaciens TaxID=1265 RepID=A0A315XZP1_RUMFL|nr:pentapeptide repeat-containing protein [Ruminococcus flavefaciens]PWJ12204.1 pentapeptide repeat protein [Ruminococcus flavefaciens]SSA49694.1 Pentapeptide repeat-containing protein [Ruminococcus flavefaciens]